MEICSFRILPTFNYFIFPCFGIICFHFYNHLQTVSRNFKSSAPSCKSLIEKLLYVQNWWTNVKFSCCALTFKTEFCGNASNFAQVEYFPQTSLFWRCLQKWCTLCPPKQHFWGPPGIFRFLIRFTLQSKHSSRPLWTSRWSSAKFVHRT
jgi:hypothetical protein